MHCRWLPPSCLQELPRVTRPKESSLKMIFFLRWSPLKFVLLSPKKKNSTKSVFPWFSHGGRNSFYLYLHGFPSLFKFFTLSQFFCCHFPGCNSTSMIVVWMLPGRQVEWLKTLYIALWSVGLSPPGNYFGPTWVMGWRWHGGLRRLYSRGCGVCAALHQKKAFYRGHGC